MEFTKMEATGNDFVIINDFEYKIEDYNNLAIKVCDRHFSVGADGMLVCVESDKADIQMLYYNSDGSRGEMCGNGIRCFSKYVYEEGIVNEKMFTVETLGGVKTIWLYTDEEDNVELVKVNMGRPVFNSKDIPVHIDREKVLEETIEIDGRQIVFSSVLVGVPHTVIFVDNMEDININQLGRSLEEYSIFPNKTNVNFIEVIDKNRINIYTWERGAGRTLGCGTGSCAGVVIGNITNRLDEIVDVKTEGGKLQVELDENYRIYMKGGANRICDGFFYNLTGLEVFRCRM
ncbi:diaminopimelate epimerase [Schnuerera sp. xch1]|uniref:diaminopimelate epimerase n=1 Tax=Schnuerera sp. xch1 TaxID=2874283 RepID=UPI001CBFF9C2|nr:diaminopimelate epimerase [Schnuerera sp. xch1]MBZ2174488.1 diaminopimelate epimerase [Schnuerera sp. xch1]